MRISDWSSDVCSSDLRILIGTGMVLVAWSTYMMAGFSLDMDESLVVHSGFIQGLGTGLIFVPLSTIAFATLAPKYRNEGTAMFTLIRKDRKSTRLNSSH